MKLRDTKPLRKLIAECAKSSKEIDEGKCRVMSFDEFMSLLSKPKRPRIVKKKNG